MSLLIKTPLRCAALLLLKSVPSGWLFFLLLCHVYFSYFSCQDLHAAKTSGLVGLTFHTMFLKWGSVSVCADFWSCTILLRPCNNSHDLKFGVTKLSAAQHDCALRSCCNTRPLLSKKMSHCTHQWLFFFFHIWNTKAGRLSQDVQVHSQCPYPHTLGKHGVEE